MGRIGCPECGEALHEECIACIAEEIDSMHGKQVVTLNKKRDPTFWTVVTLNVFFPLAVVVPLVIAVIWSTQ